MKPTILLLALLFFAASFKQPTPPAPTFMWIGTMSLYIGSDGTYLMFYEGDFDRCTMKRWVDIIYKDCDSMPINPAELNKMLKFMYPTDTCELEPVKTIEKRKINFETL